MIRLSTHERAFRCDADVRLRESDRVLEHGEEQDRLLLAREWRQAGHALIAAADAISLRVADEAEEVRRGN